MQWKPVEVHSRAAQGKGDKHLSSLGRSLSVRRGANRKAILGLSDKNSPDRNAVGVEVARFVRAIRVVPRERSPVPFGTGFLINLPADIEQYCLSNTAW